MLAKVEVSSSWEPHEREAVANIIREQVRVLDVEVRDHRKTIRYEAPCFAEFSGHRFRLSELLRFVLGASAGFLEDNRESYACYLTTAGRLWDGDDTND